MTSISSKPNQKIKARLSGVIAATLSLACLCTYSVDAGAQTKATKAKQTAGTGSEPGAKRFEELNPKDFERSENIDHAWWPLKPGMQWTFDGYVEEDGKKEKHRIVFTVTDLVKVIGGILTSLKTSNLLKNFSRTNIF